MGTSEGIMTKLSLRDRNEIKRLEIPLTVTRPHPVLKREDRLRKHPFAGFGTVMEDIKRTSYTKNQPILLGAF